MISFVTRGDATGLSKFEGELIIRIVQHMQFSDVNVVHLCKRCLFTLQLRIAPTALLEQFFLRIADRVSDTANISSNL